MNARPTPEQLAWHDTEIGMFLCLGPSTWQDREMDDLSTPLDRINPARLDTEQWVDAAEAMGAGYIVFVAKHVGGFCLWDTKTTEYRIGNTPWRGGNGDVLAELSATCRRRGMKLGVYLSPWDMQFGANVGGRCETPEKQAAYVQVFRQQLIELLSRYGEMFEVWFDGSLVFDVGDILKRHAPRAMIFQGRYATIRWVGNEDGLAPYPAWNAVHHSDARSGTSTAFQGNPDGEVWLPLECDARIRSGWFWHSQSAATLKSVEHLMRMHYHSVGRGAVLLLNHTPDTTGLIPEADVKRGAEFGAEIRHRFGQSLAETKGDGHTLLLSLPHPQRIDHAIVMEDIAHGERIREYTLEAAVGDSWKEVARGSSVGHKKIDSFAAVETDRLRLRCLQASDTPLIRRLAAFDTGLGAPTEPTPVQVWWDRRVVGEWQTDAGGVVDIELASFCTEARQYEVEFRPLDDGATVSLERSELHFNGVNASEFIQSTNQPNRRRLNLTAIPDSLRLVATLKVSGKPSSRGEIVLHRC